MRKKLGLDFAVGIAAYLAMIVLTLAISKKYSLSLYLLLPFFTLAFVVIYSQLFANAMRNWRKREERILLLMR